MEKRGVITEETPREAQPTPPSPTANPVNTKQAADAVEAHASTRAADAVANTAREG